MTDELTAIRLQRDQLHRALGRIISLFHYSGAGWVGGPVTAKTMQGWRDLHTGTRVQKAPHATTATDRAVVVGTRTPARTEAIRARLLEAGLTEATAYMVARQPLTMPVRLAPGVVISVFDLPAQAVEEAS